jgi:hypothetical protein
MRTRLPRTGADSLTESTSTIKRCTRNTCCEMLTAAYPRFSTVGESGECLQEDKEYNRQSYKEHQQYFSVVHQEHLLRNTESSLRNHHSLPLPESSLHCKRVAAQHISQWQERPGWQQIWSYEPLYLRGPNATFRCPEKRGIILQQRRECLAVETVENREARLHKLVIICWPRIPFGNIVTSNLSYNHSFVFA